MKTVFIRCQLLTSPPLNPYLHLSVILIGTSSGTPYDLTSHFFVQLCTGQTIKICQHIDDFIDSGLDQPEVIGDISGVIGKAPKR